MGCFSLNDEGEVRFGDLGMEEAKAKMGWELEAQIDRLRADLPVRQARLEAAAASYELVSALAAMRPSIKIDSYPDMWSINVTCTQEDLLDLAKVLGALEEYHKEVKDHKKRIVTYTRKSRRHPSVYVRYDVAIPKKLANGEAPKCHIETRRTVERVLVCDL
jgi:hypothetical protein